MPSASSSEVELTDVTLATCGRPLVSVPVLSKATARTRAAISRNAPPLMSTPSRLARVMPLTMETGVEITSAHGQLTTSRTSARSIHSAQPPHEAPSAAPSSGGTIAMSAARTMTDGVYQRLKRSTRVWAGALAACASSTMKTILASVESLVIAVTSTSISPVVLSVPANTTSPAPRSAGTDSPVIADSSIAVAPERTTPSSGTRSPGRTTTTAPTSTDAASISTSCSPRRTRASGGVSAMRSRIDRRVRSSERDSRRPPRANRK